MAIRRNLLRARSAHYFPTTILHGNHTQPIKPKISQYYHPLITNTNIYSHHLTSFHRTLTSTTNQHSSDLVNELSRILSDYRNPHNDIESALKPLSQQISTNIVEQVLKRCKNLGFSAHRFFIWSQNLSGFVHSKESYHILVDILGSSKQFPLLWDFFMDTKKNNSCEVGHEIFWLVFRAYSRANLPNDAIRSFDKMVDFGITPYVGDVDQLLLALCKRKHLKEAQQFFNRVKDDFVLTVKSYSIMIRGWGEVGEAVEAQKLFDEMLERGFPVDLLAYNSILESLCKAGKMDEAYNLFMKMRPMGLKPDAFTYSIFIHAYCVKDDIHSAFRVLDRMKRYNLVPNVFTYNCIVKKLCKSDKVKEAYQLIDEMIERGVRPDCWSYNTILAFHCDHKEVNLALRLISKMEKNGCQPDRHTYNMVLKMLIRVGRFDRVEKVWESMEERKIYPSASTYAVMIHGLCQKKEQTEILADKMERSTCCLIQELTHIMRGNKAPDKVRCEEQYSDTDEESSLSNGQKREKKFIPFWSS